MEKNNLTGEKNGLSKNPAEETVDFSDLVEKLILDLPERSGEIMKKRFGLLREKPQTLDRIGRDYGITRERVRQIIADSFRAIAKKTEEKDFLRGERLLFFTIEKNNGIMREIDVMQSLGIVDLKKTNAVKFLVQCSKKIQKVSEKGLIEKAWTISKEILSEVKKIEAEAVAILKKEGQSMEGEKLIELAAESARISKEKVESYLRIFSRIKRNQFGKWGMLDWKDISPKGTREKIYLVLKETGRPLHFSQIAKLIDEYKLGKRKAHPQTVHNELIKDDRFVLIGRGIYAMSEWGYSEGTIRDVLKDILKKSQKPLEKDEILKRVLKVRKVKKATIMINLNNSKVFARQDNLYTVRKK